MRLNEKDFIRMILSVKLIKEIFDIDNIFLKNRSEKYVVARSLFFHYSKFNFKISYIKLSRFSKFNHATIIHSCNNFDNYFKYYGFQNEINYFLIEIDSVIDSFSSAKKEIK